MIKIAQIVGAGDLDVELDLAALQDDLDDHVTQTASKKSPGLYFNFEDNKPTIALYRTGTFHITGAKSEDEIYQAHQQLLHLLNEIGITDVDRDFNISNVVATADLEKPLDLAALCSVLGFEQSEYEPEQFPGLIYRPSDHSSTFVIFANGKIVITGVKRISGAERAFKHLRNRLP